MPNSRLPSGPARPLNRERDAASEREEIDEALNPAATERDPREGRQPTRNQPSPEARNEDVPRDRDDQR
jgi:hypothetical protein